MSRRLLSVLALPVVLALAQQAGAASDPYANYTVLKVQNGPNVLADLKTAFLTATPGTIIQLPKGQIDVDEELSLSTDYVVIRGKGKGKTILDFTSQATGGQGILITGDHVALEDFRVQNTPGDGIRAEDVVGITFRRLWVGWEGEASEENGAYALYPVLAQDVLVEDCKVVGASDAGIYVGQSNNIVVRHNKVVHSVAGIEIENSNDADVHHNLTKKNTGGILVFNLPGLTQLGSRTRVFKNKIVNNNTPNFGSGTVGQVPPGTGIIVLANDDVEVFKNEIRDNRTVAITVASYNLIDDSPGDAGYDPYAETIYIHDNLYDHNAYQPNDGSDAKDLLGFVVGSAYEGKPPQIFNAKDEDPAKLVEGVLPAELQLCVEEDQKGVSFGSLNLYELLTDEMAEPVLTKEPARKMGPPYRCSHPRLPKIVIPDPPAPPSPEVVAACAGGSPDKYLTSCPKLSDYGLFAGNDPREPVAGGLPYDLTTPLFSDYAQKYRAVFVPDGQTVAYDPEAVLNLPVGTILAKSFAFAHDLRDLGKGEDLIETRLLIHRPAGWVGLPYIWNAQKTEAYLTVIGGKQSVSWIDADGMERSTVYRIPNANMCSRCHFDGPIGPKVRLLNRDYDYSGGVANQIDAWETAGILTDVPADPAEWPRIPVWNDPGDGTLEERARGYLETNCAHCHNPEGSARNTGLLFEWHRPVDVEYGVCKIPVAAGELATGGRLYDLVPGSADDSILIYRMDSTDPQITMPEIAKSVVHDEGVALVAEWIDSLAGGCP